MDLKEYAGPLAHRHPWELARADFFVRQIKTLRLPSAPLSVLDIGAGDAWLASKILLDLPADSTIHCVDSAYSRRTARHFVDPRIQMTSRLPENIVFDLIFMLDVVEHVENDSHFVAEVGARLKRTGYLIFSVPALPALYSDHDRALGHYRRYTPRQARELLADRGFEIVEQGSLFHGLLYARALEKSLELIRSPKSARGVGGWSRGPRVTRMMHIVLNSDWQMAEALRKLGIHIPGLSWWCVCRKR